jgi:opacity protein-like surface antigen
MGSGSDREGISASMKKMMLLGALLVCTAAVGYAQESRQDVSASAYGLFGPEVHGPGGVTESTTGALGFLGSYRYSVTPRSGLELNYSFAQNSDRYTNPSFNGAGGANRPLYVHARQQEVSGAYVYSRNYKRYNPFLEVGVGAMLLSPIQDFGTQVLTLKRNTNIGALFGGGVAYELSPSFDLRVEYRGFLLKAPDFGASGGIFKTNRYEVLSMPAVGIAYHF